MAEGDLGNLKTMRDVFDYCTKNKLYSVAQGMIELPPPKSLRKIVAEMAVSDSEQGVHQYRNRFGEKSYLDTIQKLLQRHYQEEVPVESILATAGVTGAIVAALMMLRKAGKTRIALVEPFYTYHSRQAEEIFGKAPTAIPSHDDFSPDFEQIEAHMKAGLDGLIFCNPGNPSGRCWTSEEIKKVLALAEQYKCLLIIDEIYCDMTFPPKGKHYSPIDYPEYRQSDWAVVCRGFSKTLGAQSWRLGYAISSKANIVNLMAVHDPIYISVTWMQHAMAKYLSECYEDFTQHIEKINSMLQNNWKVLAPVFQKTCGWDPIDPSGSMYGMFRHHQNTDLEALQKALKLGVGVAPATMFYGSSKGENTGFIRIHVGMSEETAKAIAKTLEENWQKQGQ